MANTIAIARGVDSSRAKTTSRLGSRMAEAEANTWHTFAKVRVYADGSGYVSVKRDGVVLVWKEWRQEGQDAPMSAEECERYMQAHEGRGCANPSEHEKGAES